MATKSDVLALSNGMEFMHVPAGKFIMGSNNGNQEEKPQHTVDIPYGYWMARYLLTNEQYNMYLKANGAPHPDLNLEKKKEHPVVNVTWDAVIEYCQWLNSLLNTKLPSGVVLRLPTEAEWEKAARGTDGREFPWGNTFDKNKCNSSEGEKGETTSVGLYSPHGDSPYGCADMAGNVWEWTHSEDKAYPYNAKDGREDEQKYAFRVIRSGNYHHEARRMRCAVRQNYHPRYGYETLGFRICLAPPLPE